MSNDKISKEARNFAIHLAEANGVSFSLGDCDAPTPANEIEFVAKRVQALLDAVTQDLRRENDKLRAELARFYVP